MVVRRTIEHLKTRPKEERTAFAASVSIVVVVILFVGWIIYFFHSIATTPAPDLQGAAASLDSNGLQQAQQEMQQAYGSTTQFIQTQGNIQLEEVGTSSETTQQ